jgi:hypothetical protein
MSPYIAFKLAMKGGPHKLRHTVVAKQGDAEHHFVEINAKLEDKTVTMDINEGLRHCEEQCINEATNQCKD